MKTSYRALLSLERDDTVTATVLENSLGVTPVWTRAATGQYGVSAENVFPMDKTFPIVSPVSVSDVDGIIAMWIDPAGMPNGFQLNVTAGGQFTDQVMQMGQVPVEIFVYPQ